MATSLRKIYIKNPDLSQTEKTALDADYTSGTSLTVINNSGWADGDILVIKTPGTEKSESQSVASTTGATTITIDSALKFNHQVGERIYRSEYNQIEVSVYTTSWSVLATVSISWDAQETLYIHQGGTDSSIYRFRYKNSATSNFSEYSGSIGGTGYTSSQAGYQVKRVRQVLKDPDGKIMTDADILRSLSDAKNIIKAIRDDWYFWLKEDEGTITTVDGTSKYNLDDISSSIEYVKDIRFRDQSGSDDIIYHLKYETPTVFEQYITDNNATEDDTLIRYTIRPPDSSSTAGYFEVDPTPATTGNGSFYPKYYQPDADYTSLSATVSIAIPHILSDYAIAEGLRIKGDETRAEYYEEKFYGPSDLGKRRGRLTGIKLLEQLNQKKLTSTGQPKQFKKFLGRNYISRAYGTARISTDAYRERYW